MGEYCSSRWHTYTHTSVSARVVDAVVVYLWIYFQQCVRVCLSYLLYILFVQQFSGIRWKVYREEFIRIVSLNASGGFHCCNKNNTFSD